MTDLHDSTFVINDIQLNIPPTAITINKLGSIQQFNVVRNRTSIKTKSRNTSLTVSLNIQFVGKSDVNSKLLPLLAQFRITPFCYVENQFLRDSIMGELGEDQNMAFAVNQISISTIPGSQETVNVNLDLVWFNYKPYTANFFFKNEPFLPVGNRQPGMAFKAMYFPTLKNYDPIKFASSDVQLATFEFLVGPSNDVEKDQNIELDLEKPNVAQFSKLLNQYLDVAEKIKNSENDTLDGANVVLDNLIDMTIRFQGGDPTLTRPQGINQINSEVAKLSEIFKTLNIETPQENEDLKKLLLKQRDVIDSSTDLFSGGDIWLEFPSTLMSGSNKLTSPNSKTEATSKLYFRKRILRMGRQEDGLIPEQVITSTGHNLTIIPMVGYQYPTIQYMGGVDSQFFFKLKILNDKALREFTTFNNVHTNNMAYSRLIPQEYLNIRIVNELVNLCGVKEVLISNTENATIPGSPGTYSASLEVLEAGVLPGELEGIRVVPTSFGAVRRKVWEIIWKNLSAVNDSIRNETSFEAIQPKLSFFPIEQSTPAESQLLSNIARTLKPEVNNIITYIFRFPLDEDIDTSFSGQKSIPLRNLTILSGLRDTEVLAVEGLTNAIWSQAPTLLTDEILKQEPGFLAKREELATRQQYLNRTHIEQINERHKKYSKALEIYKEYKTLRSQPQGEIPNSSVLKAIREDGTFFYLDQELEDIGIEKPFIEKLQHFVALAREIGTFSFDPEKLISGEMALLENKLNGIDVDIQTFGRLATVADRVFGIESNSSLRSWPAFANAKADQIINSDQINFAIFKEAKKLLSEMSKKHAGRVYRDFPLNDVSDFLKQSIPNFPNDITIEPDFYFYNETSDGNITDFIQPEDVEQTRNFARTYAENIIKNDSTWYQDYYRSKHNSAYQSMLDNSYNNNSMQSVDTNLSSLPASSQLNRPLSIGQLSNNNQATSNNTFLLANPAQGNLNQVSTVIPEAQSLVGMSNTPEAALDTPAADMSYEAEWVMPMRGHVRIKSAPGRRERPYNGASSYHKGVDLGLSNSAETRDKPVVSAAEGEVVRKRHWDGTSVGPGNFFIIKSEYMGSSYFHKYYHLNSLSETINVGDTVLAGQVIGTAGNSGTIHEHLHFEIRKNDIDGEIIYPFGQYTPRPIFSESENPIFQENLIPFGDNRQWQRSVPGISPLKAGETIFDLSLQAMKRSMNKNSGYRMNRAYPGIWISFIEEKSHGVNLRFEGFFSYQSIVSFEMARDREVAADYCKLALTNISNSLSSKKYANTSKDDITVIEKKLNPTDKDTIRESDIDAFYIQEGMKVEVRLGYSDNPEKLTDVLVGRVIAFQLDETSDIIQLEIQSLATELTQDLKGQDKSREFTNRGANDAWTGPLLTELMNSPEVVSFGAWRRGDTIGNTNRGILNSRWVHNPQPQTDNIFCPPAHELTDIEDGIEDRASNFGLLDNMKYRLYQMTIWDVFKEMELRHPEWISSPVPYSETNGSNKRMTMFFGLPDQLYYKKDPSLTDNNKTQAIKDSQEALFKSLQEAWRNGDLISNVEDLIETSATDPNEIRKLLAELNTQSYHSGLFPEGEQQFKVNSKIEEITKVHIASELAKEALENGSIEPFRAYHLITGAQHIIANNIGAKSSNTFNAVTVQYSPTGNIDVDNQHGPQINDPETFTMKVDPHIADELTRENYVVYPNCQGQEMAKRYALSILQKSIWYTYTGDLVILGNPDIKPYDICYIFDDYSDMRGPIQVRRVLHFFNKEDGFVTVITPDLVTFISEGASLTQNQAMGLMAEGMLKKMFRTNKINLVTPGRTPLEGVQTTPLLYDLAVAGAKLVNFFGGKRMIFRTQFGQPIRIHPLFQGGKPMVAGLGVIPERENMFILNDISKAFSEARVGINEFKDDFTDRLLSGRYFFNPQGSFSLFNSDEQSANDIRVRFTPR